jgi:hypothetical protein
LIKKKGYKKGFQEETGAERQGKKKSQTAEKTVQRPSCDAVTRQPGNESLTGSAGPP